MKSSTRYGPEEARKPLTQIPLPSKGHGPSQKTTSPTPTFSHRHSRWRCNKEQNPINLKTGQRRGRGKKITFCELPTRGHHTLRTEGWCSVRSGLETGGRPRVSEIESSCVASSFYGILGPPWPPSPESPAPAVGVSAAGRCLSTAAGCAPPPGSGTPWSWTCWFPLSPAAAAWARTLWPRSAPTCGSLRRARLPCSGVGVGWNQGTGLGKAGGIPPGSASPFPHLARSPAQVLEEQPQGVVVGGG